MLVKAQSPNFLVGESGLTIKTPDFTVEFFEKDGIRISNINDKPCVEFLMDDQAVAIKLESESHLKRLLRRVRHTSEFKEKSMDLMDALVSNMSSEDIVEAISDIDGLEEKSNVSFSITEEIAQLTSTQKIRAFIEDSGVLSNAKVLSVESISDGIEKFMEDPDPMAAGAMSASQAAGGSGSEESDPNDDSSNTMSASQAASGSVTDDDSPGPANKTWESIVASIKARIQEAEEEEDEEEDEEEKESLRAEISKLKASLAELTSS